MTIEQRVKNGIKLLDDKCPDWADKIDLECFNIKCHSLCVLGQVLGDYHEGCKIILSDLYLETMIENGFCGPEYYSSSPNYPEQLKYWNDLQNEWRKQIASRQYSMFSEK